MRCWPRTRATSGCTIDKSILGGFVRRIFAYRIGFVRQVSVRTGLRRRAAQSIKTFSVASFAAFSHTALASFGKFLQHWLATSGRKIDRDILGGFVRRVLMRHRRLRYAHPPRLNDEQAVAGNGVSQHIILSRSAPKYRVIPMFSRGRDRDNRLIRNFESNP